MFEALVAEAFDALSEEFGEALDNVAVVVEDWPDQETLRLAGVRSPMQLLGFYHGTPQPKRGYGYNLVPPDKISIYRRPIERLCHTEAELRAMVERVLRHEIAHHFGIDDDRLHEIDAY
ncbi:MAG: metallopeptidase family protein [Anaerolineae bacterium]